VSDYGFLYELTGYIFICSDDIVRQMKAGPMTSICFQKTYQRSFGTYPLKGAELAAAVQAAVAVGYRSIDTAQIYGNEADVGAALSRLPVPRDELCITTKVDPGNYADDKFLPSVRQSLRDLGLEQVDVLLLHWPPRDGGIAASLKLLAQARAEGLARHIGVSNFTAAMMREARDLSADPLVMNQVEFHPLLNQDVLLAAATETGIPLSSYSSVARGEVFKYPLFHELGQGYGRTPSQIVLRWILQKGVPVNSMSTKPENIAANFNVMDFTLSSIDMDRIQELTRTGYRIVAKDKVPWAPQWD
jgi:2,5-diketo-D-gluconate reductase B